jgi:hypothetical protein
MAEWRSEDDKASHWIDHRDEFDGGITLQGYHASANETIVIGGRFEYRDVETGQRRDGYYHRDSARFTGVDPDGFIRTHFTTDESYLCALPLSTYTDDY